MIRVVHLCISLLGRRRRYDGLPALELKAELGLPDRARRLPVDSSIHLVLTKMNCDLSIHTFRRVQPQVSECHPPEINKYDTIVESDDCLGALFMKRDRRGHHVGTNEEAWQYGKQNGSDHVWTLGLPDKNGQADTSPLFRASIASQKNTTH